MNKKKIIFLGIMLLMILILTGCAGDYGGYGYREYPYYDTPFPSNRCPGDYGLQYCPQ
jgi:hypothetical protein